MSKTPRKKTVREWREEFGFKQYEFAELAGCARSALGTIERGEVILDSGTGKKVLAALHELGVNPDQIAPSGRPEDTIDISAFDDFSQDAPRKPLKWWRERRALSIRALWRLSGVGVTTISSIENGHQVKLQAATKRKLCLALQIAPDSLALPGDPQATDEGTVEGYLRAELRGARHALRKAYDFMRHDPNITHRALDTRDAVLPDIERETRGL